HVDARLGEPEIAVLPDRDLVRAVRGEVGVDLGPGGRHAADEVAPDLGEPELSVRRCRDVPEARVGTEERRELDDVARRSTTRAATERRNEDHETNGN